MSHAKILLADDDRLVLVTLGKGLRQAGYQVLEASSGEEAIRLCEQEAPDLAILDIRMPGMNGIETAEALHAQYQVPFLIFSAYGDEELVSQAVNRGALGYLVKPLDVEQIVPTIATALERARQIEKLNENEMHLNRALTANRSTSTAIGILMERFHLDNDQAFQMLRGYARSRRLKVGEIAREIIQATEQLNALAPGAE